MRRNFDYCMDLLKIFPEMKIELYYYNDTLWLSIETKKETIDEFYLKRGNYGRLFLEASGVLALHVGRAKMIEYLFGKFDGIQLPHGWAWEE